MKLRNTFIKIFSIALTVCASFAVATFLNGKTVSAAEEEAIFQVNGASIYKYDNQDEGKVGLRFEAEFNKALLDKYSATKYTFGMIVAPTDNFNASFAANPEKPWSSSKSPTYNKGQVDGVNLIRIQNRTKTEILNSDKYKVEGQDGKFVFYGSILFDDTSLREVLKQKGYNPDDDQLLAKLKANIFEQGYSVVVYLTYRDADRVDHYVYLTKYDTSMRDTAAKTYAAGVAENDEGYKNLALHYLGFTEEDVQAQSVYVYQSAYVLKGVRKLVVDSVDNFEVKESDYVIRGGKLLIRGANYKIEDNTVVFMEDKTTGTNETVYVIRDNDIAVIDVVYVNRELSTKEDVIDYFTNTDNWTLSGTAYKHTSYAVLTQDFDMEGTVILHSTELHFYGLFDGRGHVLSNLAVQTKDGSKTTYGLFGALEKGAVIRNIAFNNIRAIDHQANGSTLAYNIKAGALIENIYVSYSVYNASKSGLFVLAEGGTMRNVVVVDNYYDPTFDVDTYINENKSAWGVSSIARALGAKSSTFENVHVISRKPVAFVSNYDSQFEVTYNLLLEDDPATEDVDESKIPATVKSWGSRVVYGENEEDLFVHYKYFYNKEDNLEAPGMGMAPGTASVQNTSGTDKTVVKTGLRRYDDMAAFLADEANADNRAALVATGFWKEDEDGNIVWGKSDLITSKITLQSIDQVDYDASTGILYTTAFNGDTIEKILLDKVELAGDALVRDGENRIIGIRAKVNASDTAQGMDYRDNKIGTTNVLTGSTKVTTGLSGLNNYISKVVVYTDNKIVYIGKINYYTQLIFDDIDLREAVGYDVNYSVEDLGTADKDTKRESEYNGKGYFVATTKDGSKYYEGVYNAGIYKMVADVDMYYEDKNNPENSGPKGIGYTNNPLESVSKIGGFVGNFDGNGYAIKNYNADKQGLFGRVGAYVSGNEVNSGKNLRYVQYSPTIKNFAITDVITSYYDAENFFATPILANLLGTNAYGATQTLTTVENLYVTVSTNSTAAGSLVVHLGAHAKMNNVYIANQNEFNMVEIDTKKHTMTDDPSRASATLPKGTKVWDVTRNYSSENDGVLFGWAYSELGKAPNLADDAARVTLDNTTNVYVVSTMPINFSSKSSMFVYPGYSTYLPIIRDAEVGLAFDRGNEFYKLGKVSNTASNVYVAIAYAANEEVGKILIPYGFKQDLINEAKALYAAGGTIGTYGPTTFICTACGRMTISGSKIVTDTAPSANGKCKITEGCNGVYKSVDSVPTYKQGGAGSFASFCMYTYTLHTAADMGEYYSHTNGAFKLKGVYKYDDVDAMKAANNDYSSFTGSAGNGLWEVVETKDGEGNVTARELKWVGNTKKVA